MEEDHTTQVTTSSTNFGADFLKDAAKLVSGGLLAQVIGLVLAPVLTRLFTPEHFGVSAIYTSLYTVIAVITCCRYELTIVIAKSEEEAANMLWACLLLATVTTGVLVPILFYFRMPLAQLFQSAELADLIWITPITAFCYALFLTFYNWYTRSRKFFRLTGAMVAQEVSMDSIRLGAGFSGLASSGALILSNIFGMLTAFSVLFVSFLRNDLVSTLKIVSWQKIKAGLIRYKKFPLYNTWADLLTVFSQQLSTFMLSIFFDNTINGHYSLGNRIISLPIIMLGRTIGQVFFQRAAKAKYTGGLIPLVENTFTRLIRYGLFPMLLLTVAGKDLFIILLGEKWAEAGIYIQILSIWTFFTFIGTSCTHLANIFDKQEVNLILNILIFITRVISLLVGGFSKNPHTAIWLLSISGTVLMVWYYFWVSGSLGIPIMKSLGAYSKTILLSIPFLSIVAVPIWVFHAPSLVITILSVLVAIGYYTVAILRDDKVKPVVIATLSKYLGKFLHKSS